MRKNIIIREENIKKYSDLILKKLGYNIDENVYKQFMEKYAEEMNKPITKKRQYIKKKK